VQCRAALPLVPSHGPSLVVFPRSVDLQISKGKSFLPKTQASHQPNRRHIPRLNIRLNTVQSVSSECTRHDRGQHSRHDATCVMRREHVVPKVRAAERPADDLTDVHDTHEFVRPRECKVGDVAFVRFRPHVRTEFAGGRGRRRPRSVQGPARTHRREKRALMLQDASSKRTRTGSSLCRAHLRFSGGRCAVRCNRLSCRVCWSSSQLSFGLHQVKTARMRISNVAFGCRRKIRDASVRTSMHKQRNHISADSK
jgi:hypothetical protein